MTKKNEQNEKKEAREEQLFFPVLKKVHNATLHY